MLEELLNQEVVIDVSSSYVCMGAVSRFDDQFIELKHADVHDLRDTDTSRENYIVESKRTGIKRNRRRVLIVRSEIVAIALLRDVVDT